MWPYGSNIAFSHLARAQAETGGIPDALSTVERIDDTDKRDFTLFDLIEMVLKTGKARGALSIADRIQSNWHRAVAFGQIAATQAKAGDIDDAAKMFSRALSAVNGIQDGQRSRIIALTRIARAQVEAGNVRDAEKTLSRAGSMAEGIGEYWLKADALTDVAKAQARESAELRGWGIRWIVAAQAQAQAGDFRGAVESAERLRDGKSRAVALAAIASRQAEAREFRGATGTFSRALAAAAEITVRNLGDWQFRWVGYYEPEVADCASSADAGKSRDGGQAPKTLDTTVASHYVGALLSIAEAQSGAAIAAARAESDKTGRRPSNNKTREPDAGSSWSNPP